MNKRLKCEREREGGREQKHEQEAKMVYPM
jgi:hypothetical protein